MEMAEEDVEVKEEEVDWPAAITELQGVIKTAYEKVGAHIDLNDDEKKRVRSAAQTFLDDTVEEEKSAEEGGEVGSGKPGGGGRHRPGKPSFGGPGSGPGGGAEPKAD
jgi:hypothetical protein